MSNTRIKTVNGITTESIANYIHLRYDPVLPTSLQVQMAFQNYVLDSNGNPTPHISFDKMLTKEIAEFATSKVAEGLTSSAGVNLGFLTGADLVTIIKNVADKWHNGG